MALVTTMRRLRFVRNAGLELAVLHPFRRVDWIPAFAGMTMTGVSAHGDPTELGGD